MSHIDTENDRNPKIFQFSKILCNFSQFSTDFVDWNVKKFNKERMSCRPGGFFEEFIAVFQVTMSQIDTENDKNLKVFKFSKIVCMFFQSFDGQCK